MKKSIAVAAVAMLLSCSAMGFSTYAAESDSVNVGVSVVDNKGQIVLADESIKVTDVDSDGKLTINDAFIIAHEEKFEGGKDGFATTEKDFTWTVAEGTLTANIKGANDSTYQVDMHMSDDGRIMLISKARDGSDVSAYYKSVEDFTEFDFDSVNFDYAALSE